MASLMEALTGVTQKQLEDFLISKGRNPEDSQIKPFHRRYALKMI